MAIVYHNIIQLLSERYTSSYKSAKWDELTTSREFSESDAPTLALLCQWYEVIDKCMDDLTYGDQIQVAYQNDIGDLKAMPQLATMKQASAEIRALNAQLGIRDTTEQTMSDFLLGGGELPWQTKGT